ncbi:uncharacterized protein [Diadema setosum]|uniref:uncharacterized protein n=1 Tax=Diadema setosum TaxID=31175 RepID=UPI003B3A7711
MANLHWEAVRRQKFIDRKHEALQRQEEQRKELAEKNQQQLADMREKGSQSASYIKQVMEYSHGATPCNHLSMDERRRLEHQEILKEHFHKTRLRYNDVDCAQQW